jgi:ABC-2 type transport system permease protein
MMPKWLQGIAEANPLTYMVDALRALMIVGASSTYGITLDFLALLAGVIVLVAVGAKLYPRMVV